MPIKYPVSHDGHFIHTVIVFGTPGIARIWLGVDNEKPDKPDAGDGK